MQDPMRDELEDLAALAALLTILRTTPQSNLKIELITEAVQRTPRLAGWLRAALDPWRQYYFTATEVSERRFEDGLLSNGRPSTTLWEFLKKCHNRQMGRNLAMSNWVSYAQRLAGPLLDAAACVVNKDLKAKVGVKLLNKALAAAQVETIPEYETALGEPWDGVDAFWEGEGEWYISRKFDGLRCQVFFGGGDDAEAKTRSGTLYTTLGKLCTVLADWDGPRMVLDGELALATRGGDDFQGIMKEWNRKDHTIQNPVLHCFDLLTLGEFKSQCSNRHWSERQAELRSLLWGLECPAYKLVTQKPLGRDPALLARWSDMSKARGWEGLMARFDGPYVGRRSWDILKIKHWQDAEYVVEKIRSGTKGIQVDGVLQERVCMAAVGIRHKGNLVGVGSGWTDEERLRYYEDPSLIIGKTITVQYVQETADAKGNPSLRFPTVKAIHGETRTT